MSDEVLRKILAVACPSCRSTGECSTVWSVGRAYPAFCLDRIRALASASTTPSGAATSRTPETEPVTLAQQERERQIEQRMQQIGAFIGGARSLGLTPEQAVAVAEATPGKPCETCGGRGRLFIGPRKYRLSPPSTPETWWARCKPCGGTGRTANP